MTQLVKARVVTGDLSPTAGADSELPVTMTPEGRLRVDAALSVSDVEVTITEYTEDAAAAANPVGPVILAVRRDTLVTTEVSADGDNIALKATNKGELHTRNTALEALIPASLGAKTMAASFSIVLASDHGGVPTVAVRPATGTQTSVAGSASDVTILAANGGRFGATVYNDSSAILYLLLASGTSSSSNYTVQLGAGAYYEVPFNYSGVLKGIWASATGNARVTEFTT